MSWVPHTALSWRFVTLEPLTVEHSDELLSSADDPSIFTWTGPALTDVAGARAYIDTALSDAARRPYLQRDARTGECVGTTSYYQIDPVNRSLAIGYTWLRSTTHGTSINPESKYLLLERAFEELGAVRVEWHTDAFNARSRAAITKLGAHFEGLLRKHRRRPDGTWRTTAIFSMTDDEWPAARSALKARFEGNA